MFLYCIQHKILSQKASLRAMSAGGNRYTGNENIEWRKYDNSFVANTKNFSPEDATGYIVFDKINNLRNIVIFNLFTVWIKIEVWRRSKLGFIEPIDGLKVITGQRKKNKCSWSRRGSQPSATRSPSDALYQRQKNRRYKLPFILRSYPWIWILLQ